ncbi:MAG: hypothetical protein WCB11_28905, partial [Terriglobales bacterium]
EQRVAELQPDSVGIGIGGMKQRAKEFGGELRLINTNPGTLVELIVPVSKSTTTEVAVLNAQG